MRFFILFLYSLICLSSVV